MRISILIKTVQPCRSVNLNCQMDTCRRQHVYVHLALTCMTVLFPLSVEDPDREGGGGGDWTTRPWDKGEPGLQKTFFQPVWSLTIRGGPGSAIVFIMSWSMYMYLTGPCTCIYMIPCLTGKVWVGVHHLWEVFDRCWRKERTMLNTSFWKQPIRIYSNNAHYEVANCSLLPRSWKLEHVYWLHYAGRSLFCRQKMKQETSALRLWKFKYPVPLCLSNAVNVYVKGTYFQKNCW